MKTLIKCLIVLLAAVVIVVDAKPTPGPSHHPGHHTQQKPHCSRYRGQSCVEDTECACVNRHNSTLICNFGRKCERLSPIDVVLRRIMGSQPCPKVFKRYCLEDADCPCTERPLICEDHECVKDRTFRRHQIF